MSDSEREDLLGREGLRRREELLRRLGPVVERRGRRRLAVHAGLLGVVIVSSVVGALRVIGPADRSGQGSDEVALVEIEGAASPRVSAREGPNTAPGMARAAFQIERVPTLAGMAHRLEGSRRVAVPLASDEDLIAALRASGLEAGIVRIDGQVVAVGGVRATMGPASRGVSSGGRRAE